MTGVLYAAVVAMWVAVIVPTYLKRHDRRELERSFSSPLADQLAARRAAWAARPQMTARQRAFIRRRRTLMTLLTALIFSTLLAATGRLAWYAVLVPLGATAAFVRAAVVVARTHARPAARMRPEAVAPTAAQPHWHHTTVAAPVAQPANPRAWRPTAPVLPSYLTASAAPARPQERPWTSQDMLAEVAVVRQQRSERIREAQAQFEKAKADAMERARRAALDAAREHEEYRGPRAVND